MLQKTCPKRAGLFYPAMLFLHQDNLFAAKGDAILQDFLNASCLKVGFITFFINLTARFLRFFCQFVSAKTPGV